MQNPHRAPRDLRATQHTPRLTPRDTASLRHRESATHRLTAAHRGSPRHGDRRHTATADRPRHTATDRDRRHTDTHRLVPRVLCLKRRQKRSIVETTSYLPPLLPRPGRASRGHDVHAGYSPGPRGTWEALSGPLGYRVVHFWFNRASFGQSTCFFVCVFSVYLVFIKFAPDYLVCPARVARLPGFHKICTRLPGPQKRGDQIT